MRDYEDLFFDDLEKIEENLTTKKLKHNYLNDETIEKE